MEPKRLPALHWAPLKVSRKPGQETKASLPARTLGVASVAVAIAGLTLTARASDSAAGNAQGANEAALALPSRWKLSGSVGFETSGFIRSSVDRGPQSTTWQMQGRAERKVAPWLDFAAEARLLALDLDGKSMTPDLPEIYFATPMGFMGNQSFTLGRRKFVWSQLDERWKLGLWSPRLTWDPFKPDTVGNVGAFYEFKTRKWSVLLFGSPLSVPERSFPLQEVQGHLVSSSPFWNAPFETVEVLGKTVDLHYSIVMPQISQLLLAPQAALSVTYGESKGAWFRANYGAGASNQLALAIDAGLDLTSLKIQSELHPRRQLRQLATFEAGYRGQSLEFWSSFSGEAIAPENLPSGWMTNPSGTSLYSAVGAGMDWGLGFKSDVQFLSIDLVKENPSKVDPTTAASMGASFLPGRFVYQKAVDAQVSWSGPSAIDYGARWLVDLGDQGQMVSLELSYVPARLTPRSRWSLRLGADFVFTETGQGQIGQQQGNDRLRGGLSYAL